MIVYFTNNEIAQDLTLSSELVDRIVHHFSPPTGGVMGSVYFKTLQSKGYIGSYFVYKQGLQPNGIQYICNDEDICMSLEEEIQGQVPQYPIN